LLDHQNNYIKHLSINDNVVKLFNILAISLSVLHNYFDGPNKIIFTSVYTAKFLYILQQNHCFRLERNKRTYIELKNISHNNSLVLVYFL